MNTHGTTQSHPHDRYDDEINLAELIELLLKRKWFIVGGTSISAIVGLIMAFSTPIQYESEALILVSSNPLVVKSNEGAQMSEVVVSALEASTYEVLAKSDELIFALADTLMPQLASELTNSKYDQLDSYSLAQKLMANTEVELIKADSELKNVSSTPLLVFSYKSTVESLPPLVVNAWAELFQDRNQGLSSNVTDEFYQNVVRQYEQAKDNLDEKEYELASVLSTSNSLNRLKAEMSFQDTQLNSALQEYQKQKIELIQKKKEYEHVNSMIKSYEIDGRWIGYLPDQLLLNNINKEAINKDLINIKIQLNELRQDSLSISLENQQKEQDLESDIMSQRLAFEDAHELSIKRIRLEEIDRLINEYRKESVTMGETLISMQLKVSSFNSILIEEQPVIVTRKAITNEELWRQTSGTGKINSTVQSELSKTGLINEEVNPVYTALLDSLAKSKSNLDFHKKRLDYILPAIDSLEYKSSEMHEELRILGLQSLELEQSIGRKRNDLKQRLQQAISQILQKINVKHEALKKYESEYLSLQSRREMLGLEINRLNSSTAYYMDNYASWRDQHATLSVRIDSLEIERRSLERDILVYKESFDRFAKLREEARIARQQAAGDITIASRANIVNSVSQDKLRYILLATITGFIVLSISSILYETVYLIRTKNLPLKS